MLKYFTLILIYILNTTKSDCLTFCSFFSVSGGCVDLDYFKPLRTGNP